mgnify:CR=1 FL=1
MSWHSSLRSVMEINDIKKVYLNPLLKDAGFKVYKTGWIRKIEDGYFTISLQKGRYNSKQSAGWGFWFNVLSTEDFQKIKESKAPLWYGPIGIRNLIPFEGIFHELIGTNYYFDVHFTIDDKNSVEILGKKVTELFKEYVLPFSNSINNLDDFKVATQNLEANKRPHETEVIHFFLVSVMGAFPRVANIKGAIADYKKFNMSKSLIENNIDIFNKLVENSKSSTPKEAIHQFMNILMALDDKKTFCKEVNTFVDMNINNPESDLKHIEESDYDMFLSP